MNTSNTLIFEFYFCSQSMYIILVHFFPTVKQTTINVLGKLWSVSHIHHFALCMGFCFLFWGVVSFFCFCFFEWEARTKTRDWCIELRSELYLSGTGLSDLPASASMSMECWEGSIEKSSEPCWTHLLHNQRQRKVANLGTKQSNLRKDQNIKIKHTLQNNK